jgi:glycosyltransferase domain-containing protein
MINQNSLLSNLTIVVISLNRQNYIQRQIQFWSRTSVNLLIVDGSKTQADLDLGAKISSKIRYVHSPGSYRDRSLLAAGLIETEYVAQLADDEFFIPSALSEFVEALQEDSSIDAIQGRTIRFFEKNGSMIGARQYEDFRDDLGCNVRGIEGVKSFWSDNYVINYPIYSVMRVSVYVKMIRSTYSNPCENAYGYEIRYNLLFPFWFTTKVFNTLFWLRSNENDPISDIGFDRSSKFSSWFLNPNNREEINLFLYQTVSVLDINKLAELKIISEMEQILLRYSLREDGKLSVTSEPLIDRISRKSRRYLGPRLRDFIVSRLPKSLKSVIGYELRKIDEVGNDLSKIGIKVDHTVLKEIECMVINKH